MAQSYLCDQKSAASEYKSIILGASGTFVKGRIVNNNMIPKIRRPFQFQFNRLKQWVLNIVDVFHQLTRRICNGLFNHYFYYLSQISRIQIRQKKKANFIGKEINTIILGNKEIESFFMGNYALEGQLLLHSSQICGIGVAEVGSPSTDCRLVVNAVPNDLIIQPSCHAPTHRKSEFPFKGFLQQFQYLVAFRSIWQVTCSRSTGVRLAVPIAAMHVVTDDDRSFGVARAQHIFIARYGYLPVGLISGHVSENGGADGTFGPFFASDQLQQADFMEFVGAAQHEDVVVELFVALLFDGFDYEFLEADHALLVFHVNLAEGELDGVEVGYIEYAVVFLFLDLILAIDFFDEEGDGFEEGAVVGDFVFVVQVDGQLLVVQLLHAEARLLVFHTFIKEQPHIIKWAARPLFLFKKHSQAKLGLCVMVGEISWQPINFISIPMNAANQPSIPLKQAGQVGPDAEFCLLVVEHGHFPVEFLNLCVFGVIPIIAQGFNEGYQVVLAFSLEGVQSFRQLELVAVNDFLHEFLPLTVVNLLDVELLFYFVAAAMNVVAVGCHLELDDLDVRLELLFYLLVVEAVGKLGEVSQFEEVNPLVEQPIELFHVVEGLLGDDEERDVVIGLDLCKFVDVGGDELEDKHDVVASVEVEFLILFECVINFLLLLVFLQQPCDIVWFYWLGLLNDGFIRAFLPLDVPFQVHVVLVHFHALLIEIFIVHDPDRRSQAVDHLLFGFDEGVVVDFTPGYSVLGVNCQAAVDEIAGVLGDEDGGKIRTGVSDLLEDVWIAHSHKRIFTVEHLIVDDADGPDVGLHSVGSFLQQLRGHCQTCPKNGSCHLLFHLLGKSQICNFADSLMQKHISQFKVPVHSLDLMQGSKTIQNLFQKIISFIFRETFLCVEILLEVASVAVFHCNENAVFGHPVVDVAYDVLIFWFELGALFQHFDFGLDQLFQLWCAFQEHLWDGFYRDDVAVAFIDCFVDHGPCAFAQHFQEAEGFQLLALHLLVVYHFYLFARDILFHKIEITDKLCFNKLNQSCKELSTLLALSNHSNLRGLRNPKLV